MNCRLVFATLLVAPALAKAADAPVSVSVVKDGIEFKSGSVLVAKYATDAKYSKPFLYPVLAPGNVPVTRAYPIEPAAPGGTNDHIHQKSVWFCHGDVIPEGIALKIKASDKNNKGVDFWSETKDKDGTKRHGDIKCVKIGEPDARNRVETRNEWFTPDGVKILDEVRTIRFQERPEGRLFTFDIVLKATVCPISFGDTKEGSFGIRTHDALRPSEKTGATVSSAEGKVIAPGAKDNLAVWGYPSAWIDYSGTVDGKQVGIAVFDHPGNPPANWHARAYGLNAANPFAREASGFPSQKGKSELFRIEKGGELVLHYAVYAHTGDVKTGKVAEAYEEFKK